MIKKRSVDVTLSPQLADALDRHLAGESIQSYLRMLAIKDLRANGVEIEVKK